MDKSKCFRGGLHHAAVPLVGGQKLVAVTWMVPGRHHCGSSTHIISKQAPQVWPLLKSAVLSAVVSSP